MANILVLEDDKELNRLVCNYLSDQGYLVKGCHVADEAFDAMYAETFDLIVSDIMLPKTDGYEVAETIRRLDGKIPILFMSARDDLASKEKGFTVGIDDYMTKPIELAELAMRVRALLRRANIESAQKIQVGKLLLDADALTATVSGDAVALTTREFKILYKLLSYPNKAFSRSQLMNEFWDVEADSSLRAVDVYVTRLRDKFSHCRDFKIVTVRGLGYKAVLE